MKYTNYFEMSKKDTPTLFPDFAFMSKAMSKDTNRFFMTHILCDVIDGNITMIETDGYRMHILTVEKSVADDFGIIPGTWDCVFSSAGKIGFARINTDELYVGQFPNWKKVLPEGNIVKTLSDIQFPNFSKNNSDNMRTDLNKVFHCLDERFGMNLFYLSDLRPFSWTVNFRDGFKSVEFISENKKAIIMPMTCKW